MVGAGFSVVFGGTGRRVGGVSLNRSEQQLYDYVQKSPEERRHWEYKTRILAANTPDVHEAARLLDAELWQYYLERAGVLPEFKRAVQREGTRRISMKNLAEYLLRLWGPVRVAKRPPDERGSAQPN